MSNLKITKATYGGSNCLEKVKSLIKNDKLILRASNEIIGDPQPGILKYLEIEINGILEKIKEGDTFVYPKSTTNKLGIWYSNDTTNHPAVQKSLETIKKSSKGKVDIITCVWNPIPNNPFYQIISWNRSSSHLNQLLQILQCIYVGKTLGEYEYVSFLEHDVMYGEGYFDYPNFNKGEVLTNMNYGGINKEGWQYREQNDEPMHQMTMRIEDALQHFHSILGNALITNSGMIEDQKLIRKQWECKNSSIHINHGSHFTSHFSIYSKDNIYKTHLYWGEHSQYSYLFI
jgi:hypothetical protein